MATVYRISNVMEDLCNDTLGGNDNNNSNHHFGWGGRHGLSYDDDVRLYDYGTGKHLEAVDWIPLAIDRYLNLKLMDLSVLINGISLYHLLVYRDKMEWLKIVLESAQCDWSAFQDNQNQV